jgi:hypothetical protein
MHFKASLASIKSCQLSYLFLDRTAKNKRFSFFLHAAYGLEIKICSNVFLTFFGEYEIKNVHTFYETWGKKC